MKASEHLAGVLSDYALEAFDAIGMERDAELAGSPDELLALLEARGAADRVPMVTRLGAL